jgi:shikimate kinase
MKNKIYLVGSMGSGKSSIGRLLAKKLKLPHYDLDKIMEIDQGMSISTIFQKHNEEYFRNLESITLEKYSKLNSFVISTGGGAILKEKNQKLFSDGCVIYLKISLDAQYERIKNRSHRPLLDKKDVKSELEILDNIRGKIYENVSNIEVDVSNLDKEDVLSSIINKL